MKKRHAKSYAREKAMVALFSETLLNKKIKQEEIQGKDPLAFQIVNDVDTHREEIDAYIKKNLKKWLLEEMNPVNRIILEVAIWEMLFDTTPTGIIISEALNFADIYSDGKAQKFIHYVLDNVNQEIKK